MDSTLKNIMTLVMQILTGSFIFMSIFIPLLRGMKRMIKEHSLLTDSKDIALSFSFLYCAILSFTLLLIIQNPQDYVMALFTGFGLAVILSFFLLITLTQKRIFKGWGDIESLMTMVTKKRKKKD